MPFLFPSINWNFLISKLSRHNIYGLLISDLFLFSVTVIDF